jgi:ribosome maturation factor RimP
MKENIASLVMRHLEKPIATLGYTLFDVEYAKKQNGMNLTLFITKPIGEITIDDCEKTHRLADKLLDDLNPTKDESYILNVSSLGLDRILKTDKDFNFATGKRVEITVFRALFKVKHFVATLEHFDENNVFLSDVVVLDQNGKKSKTSFEQLSGTSNLQIERPNVASCKLYVEI